MKVVQGYYRHFKGGMYHVLGVSTSSESGKQNVIYQDPAGKLWDRPYEMFTEEVEGVPRFERCASQAMAEMRFYGERKQIARQWAEREGLINGSKTN